MEHVKASVRFGVVPEGPTLSQIQWLQPRVTRIFVLAAWAADPAMLVDPGRVDRQTRTPGVPRLPTGHSSGIRPEFEPRLLGVKPQSFQMTYLMPSRQLWALCQMVEEVDATPGVIVLSIADHVLWPLREMPRQPERVAEVLPELRHRLSQIEGHFA